MESSHNDHIDKLKKMVQRHPLVFYFVLAYAFSWIISIPIILSTWKVIPGDYSIGLYFKQWAGPALAAIIMTRITGGQTGMLHLRQRIRHWRDGWQWYLVIILGIPLLVLLGIIIQPDALTNFQGFDPRILGVYPVFFIGIFFGTGLPEEIGWRGFALPRMQQRFGPLWSSLILGSMWAFWHVPSFLLPAHGGGPGVSLFASLFNFAVFFAMVAALCILFTWVYNRTQGSIFIASLLHTAINAPQLVWAPLFMEVGATNSTAGELSLNLSYLIVFGTLALLILVFTRGKLGYQPIQEH